MPLITPSLKAIRAELESAPSQPMTPEEKERIRAQINRRTAADDLLDAEYALVEARERLREERRYVVDLSLDIPEPVPVVTLDGQTVCSRGNISAVVGEPKCKKTFFCSAMVGGLLSTSGYMGFDARDLCILWADTEQSESHVQRVARRMHAIANLDCSVNDEHLCVLKLRELQPKERLGKIVDRIFELRPDLVVIDGIADLQYNTNDLAESEEIINRLMHISSALKIHILSVLHTNIHSDKARGHVGSSLLRKAETVFYVRRVGDVSVVEPQYCRNEPFERFAFRVGTVGDMALPELAPLPAEQESEDSCVTILRDHFGGTAERELLISKLSEVKALSHNAAKIRVSRSIKRGAINLKEDNIVAVS